MTATVMRLPRCSVDPCKRVATRNQYRVIIEGVDQGLLRMCFEHEKNMKANTNETKKVK